MVLVGLMRNCTKLRENWRLAGSAQDISMAPTVPVKRDPDVHAVVFENFNVYSENIGTGPVSKTVIGFDCAIVAPVGEYMVTVTWLGITSPIALNWKA